MGKTAAAHDAISLAAALSAVATTLSHTTPDFADLFAADIRLPGLLLLIYLSSTSTSSTCFLLMSSCVAMSSCVCGSLCLNLWVCAPVLSCPCVGKAANRHFL